MEISGTIVKIFDEKVISQKLTIREFVVKTGDQYPQEIIMQLANQKTDLIIGKKVGDEVNVHINIRGRKSNNGSGDRWFNSIEAWKID